MTRVATAIVAAICLAGCAKSAPAPLHYESYCKPGMAPDFAAVRRVAAALEDGTQIKSPSGPFSWRPKRYLDQFGGVTATWKSIDFDLPVTVSDAKRLGFEPFALAIPDDGPENGVHRILFLAFRSLQNSRDVTWTPQSSSDRENTCK